MDSREERSHGGPPQTAWIPRLNRKLDLYIYIVLVLVFAALNVFMLSFIFGFVLMQACLCVGPLKEEAVATAASVVCHCCLINHR